MHFENYEEMISTDETADSSTRAFGKPTSSHLVAGRRNGGRE
jgi:hypothetical protein